MPLKPEHLLPPSRFTFPLLTFDTRWHLQKLKMLLNGCHVVMPSPVQFPLQDIAALVDTGDALQINLNPITKANTEKALQRIISQTGLALGPQALTSIADAASGDLHNALETLQLMCAGVAVNPAAGKAKKGSQVCVRLCTHNACQHGTCSSRRCS